MAPPCPPVSSRLSILNSFMDSGWGFQRGCSGAREEAGCPRRWRLRSFQKGKAAAASRRDVARRAAPPSCERAFLGCLRPESPARGGVELRKAADLGQRVGGGRRASERGHDQPAPVTQRDPRWCSRARLLLSLVGDAPSSPQLLGERPSETKGSSAASKRDQGKE